MKLYQSEDSQIQFAGQPLPLATFQMEKRRHRLSHTFSHIAVVGLLPHFVGGREGVKTENYKI